jgi:magnesium transporter
LRENEYVAQADEDQESMAKKMVHYGLSMVPVVGNESYFLGVISNQTLVDVLVEEATEDIQKMVALSPMKESYFQTPFLRLFYQRSYILAILLLAESFSRTILDAYEETIGIFLMTFVPMLISVGGNTSSQTSAMVIQGMATGDLHESNVWRFLKRELFMATLLALFLGCVAFLRVSFTHALLIERIVVSVSLSLIVLVSVSLGGCIPLILKKLRLDPAFSAAPFLATIMDILGIFVYCYVSKLILG